MAVRFFLQLAVILLVCRAVGWFGRRYLGQTQVVMEMIAGVLLGPSLFGLLAPQAQSWLFPQTAIVGEASIRHPSMSVLYVASQLGLVLYMFLVGLEFETSLLRQKAKGAVSVSLSGIVLPFALGVLASTWMREPGVYFNESAKAWEGAVFMGAAMCITAFPMLARIISERGLAGTTMGTLALAAGATDDAMAWAMLAVVLSSFTSTPSYALWAIGGGALFLCFMLLARPLLQRLEAWTQREGTALPLFFTYSGLNTKVQLLGVGNVMAIALVVVLFAIVGKWVGCMLAARLAGETWRDASAIGVLMNARGLMELIILNIGLQHGVITPTLYTVMVLMAIVTTVMASPIFAKWYGTAGARPSPG